MLDERVDAQALGIEQGCRGVYMGLAKISSAANLKVHRLIKRSNNKYTKLITDKET